MPYLGTRVNLSAQEEATYAEFLCKEQQQEPGSVVSSSITARFTKIRDEFDQIKVLTRDPYTRDETFKRIAQTSHFFDKFSDDRITHFYIDPIRSTKTKETP